jgi:hypothetical protein
MPRRKAATRPVSGYTAVHSPLSFVVNPMNKLLPVILACLGAACTSNPVIPADPADPAAVAGPAPAQPAALYSAAERSDLFGCSALTDTAMIIAEMKQNGTLIEAAKGYFAGRPNADLTLATVDMVYDAAIKNIWDYATVFFRDCATHVAKVPATRSGPASVCMLDGMIAANAQTSKQAGVPIDKVERYFSGFAGDMPKAIIARVYAQPQTRAAAHAQAWNSCMDSISGG